MNLNIPIIRGGSITIILERVKEPFIRLITAVETALMTEVNCLIEQIIFLNETVML